MYSNKKIDISGFTMIYAKINTRFWSWTIILYNEIIFFSKFNDLVKKEIEKHTYLCKNKSTEIW